MMSECNGLMLTLNELFSIISRLLNEPRCFTCLFDLDNIINPDRKIWLLVFYCIDCYYYYFLWHWEASYWSVLDVGAASIIYDVYVIVLCGREHLLLNSAGGCSNSNKMRQMLNRSAGCQRMNALLGSREYTSLYFRILAQLFFLLSKSSHVVLPYCPIHCLLRCVLWANKVMMMMMFLWLVSVWFTRLYRISELHL